MKRCYTKREYSTKLSKERDRYEKEHLQNIAFKCMFIDFGGLRRAQSFTSAEDGLIITADSSWQMPDKEDGLQAAYGESESEVAEMVECILEQNGGKALCRLKKMM